MFGTGCFLMKHRSPILLVRDAIADNGMCLPWRHHLCTMIIIFKTAVVSCLLSMYRWHDTALAFGIQSKEPGKALWKMIPGEGLARVAVLHLMRDDVAHDLSIRDPLRPASARQISATSPVHIPCVTRSVLKLSQRFRNVAGLRMNSVLLSTSAKRLTPWHWPLLQTARRRLTGSGGKEGEGRNTEEGARAPGVENTAALHGIKQRGGGGGVGAHAVPFPHRLTPQLQAVPPGTPRPHHHRLCSHSSHPLHPATTQGSVECMLVCVLYL